MTNKQIFKHIRALAHEECANCHAGNCALTDERCHITTPIINLFRMGQLTAITFWRLCCLLIGIFRIS